MLGVLLVVRPSQSLWEIYRDIYDTSQVSMFETIIVTLASQATLRQYPHNLPRKLAKPLLNDFQEMMGFVVKNKPIIGRQTKERKHFKWNQNKELLFNTLLMAMSKRYSGRRKYFDFQRQILCQEIVMTYAHLDAFLADTIRIICKAKPEVMKADKTVTFETILSARDQDELIDTMADEWVRDFSYRPIKDQLKEFGKRFGLSIICPDRYLKLIHEGELVRHIFVHNGGKVNRQFLLRSGKTNLHSGELFPITHIYTRRLNTAIQKLCGQIFCQVSRKFLKASRDQVFETAFDFFVLEKSPSIVPHQRVWTSNSTQNC
jgi:hypothetical protein